MNDPRIDGAIEALVEQLQAQMREVAETKRFINKLCVKAGREPMYEEAEEELGTPGAIRPDQYYGKPLATAVQDYLNRRKSASSAEEILRALTAGGFDFASLNWRDDAILRSLSMSIAKNTQTFHRLPNGMYGLVAWYPNVKRKTKGDKSNGAEVIEPDQE